MFVFSAKVADMRAQIFNSNILNKIQLVMVDFTFFNDFRRLEVTLCNNSEFVFYFNWKIFMKKLVKSSIKSDTFLMNKFVFIV